MKKKQTYFTTLQKTKMKRTFQNIIWQSKEVKAVSEALNAYESTYEKLNIKKGERDIYVN